MKKATRMNIRIITIFLIICGVFLLWSQAYKDKTTGILPPIEKYQEPKILGMEVLSLSRVRFYVTDDMRQDEFKPLVECFMAAVTIPSKDLRVNLKLNERHNITPYRLGITTLGKIMLEQDYLLKVAVSTAKHPKNESGRNYWNKMYFAGMSAEATARHCIIPDEIEILDGDMSMLINKATLDVEREELSASFMNCEEIMDETIEPVVKEYVREDIHFAPIRQAYRAVICAVWFKNKYLNTPYYSYINHDKTGGIEIDFDKRKVWDEYALMRKNRNWRRSYPRRYGGPPRTQDSGGVTYKKMAKHISVKEIDHTFVGKTFDVEFLPLDEEPEHQFSEEQYFEKKQKVGGISLDATIEVKQGTIPATDDEIRKWRQLNGLGYRIR